ncbi:MAG: NmrA family NAD(P)-binding protein [Gammaproteobacteria bacterium]
MSKPIIVIVNGTADEGYWAAYYLLKSGHFRVRATVRRLDSERAERLRLLEFDGERCELVVADTENEAALRAAFDGAYGIYGTTVYNIYAKKYRADNPEEMAQGLALIAAAKTCATLEHFVWQTMTRFDRPPEELGLEAPIHFRTKWQLEEQVKEAGLPWTFLRQPAYMRQVAFGMQFRNRLVYPYPHDTRLVYVAEEDLGKFVAAIFADRDAHLHGAVNGATEVLTPVELAARAHALNPDFSPKYRKATWIENAFFDYVIVGLKPAFRYPSQINQNLMNGNCFGMTLADKQACEDLIAPLKLNTLEDFLRERFAAQD